MNLFYPNNYINNVFLSPRLPICIVCLRFYKKSPGNHNNSNKHFPSPTPESCNGNQTLDLIFERCQEPNECVHILNPVFWVWIAVL
jgi:hypothetical protein